MPTAQPADSWLDREEVLAVTFHPRREAPAAAVGFERLSFAVAPGVTVDGRFYAAGSNAPTLLFFHGNGEIVADYHGLVPAYLGQHVNFMPVDYRGYGLSGGRPTVATMLSDAGAIYLAARQWLKERGYDGRFIVMGRSLGSASALQLASSYPREIDGLIIDSGFAHLVPLLARLGAPVPRGAATQDAAAQIGKVRGYAGPTLIIHGTRDVIIPVQDAEDLYAASPSTAKHLMRVPGAGHNDILAVDLRGYFKAVGTLARGEAR
jgi:pimeloyl-ACP methyl ester carboxylesterase